MSNPFDYVKSINETKQNLIRNTENDELAEEGYSPFLTNRALSYHHDTVQISNEINMRAHLDNALQYEFLLNSIRKKKRFAKWDKKIDDGDLALVKEDYGYGDAKASQALSVLTPEQLHHIKEKLQKGGRNA